MPEQNNPVALPDYNGAEQAAKEVIDFLRPKGYPIDLVRSILRTASDRLDMEPLRYPKPVYKLPGEE